MVKKKCNISNVNKICKDIKDIKIQGATNIAKAALKAYYFCPGKKIKNKLLKLRPTEPMLSHVLDIIDKKSKQEILNHFSEAQEEINKSVYKLIKSNSVIFTHCHSTNVIKALIYSKKKGKKFEVYNTETRPLYQGRKTTKELKNNKIKTTQFVDAAASIALTKEQGTRKVSLVLLGADAILKNGVINKVGSGMISQIAYDEKIPVYIVADSWKNSPSSVKLEQRDFDEIWKNAPKNIKIKNMAFEMVEPKHIKGIVSELGILSFKEFLRKVKKK